MLTAIYNGKTICSLDTKNKYGNYETDVYEHYKKAGQKGELICDDCGTEVILKAGNIKIPHFAHKTHNRDCYYEKTNESEEHKKGKFILYSWLKEQYKDYVYINKKYGNRRANVSIETDNGIVAFQYIRSERNLIEWEDKRNDYLSSGIINLYFFSACDFRKEYTNSKEQFKKIVQKYSNDLKIKMIDTDTKELILLKYMDIRDDNGLLICSKPFVKKYNIYEIKISSKGQILTDFDKHYTLNITIINRKS